jgi:hypothetical protein
MAQARKAPLTKNLLAGLLHDCLQSSVPILRPDDCGPFSGQLGFSFLGFPLQVVIGLLTDLIG